MKKNNQPVEDSIVVVKETESSITNVEYDFYADVVYTLKGFEVPQIYNCASLESLNLCMWHRINAAGTPHKLNLFFQKK